MTPTQPMPIPMPFPVHAPAPTCLKCSAPCEPVECDCCEYAGRDDSGKVCRFCEGLGEVFECTECFAQWTESDVRANTIETMRGQWGAMLI